jgi:hypothetical protein
MLPPIGWKTQLVAGVVHSNGVGPQNKILPFTALNANAPPIEASTRTANNMILSFFIKLVFFKSKKLNFNKF